MILHTNLTYKKFNLNTLRLRSVQAGIIDFVNEKRCLTCFKTHSYVSLKISETPFLNYEKL